LQKKGAPIRPKDIPVHELGRGTQEEPIREKGKVPEEGNEKHKFRKKPWTQKVVLNQGGIENMGQGRGVSVTE